MLLDADIQLTPLKKKSLRTEVQMTSKSNNFVGPGISFTFTNRNFLKGGEMFQVRLNTAYEVQISSQTEGEPLNAVEVRPGIQSYGTTFYHTLSALTTTYSKYIPKTVFRAGVNIQNRVGYYQIEFLFCGL